MGNCFENFKSFPLLNIDTKHYHLKVIAADKIFLVRNILSGGIWVVSRTTQIAWHQLAPHCNLTGWPRRTPGKNWDTTPACLAAKPNISFESCYPDLFVLPAALQGVEQTLVNMNDSPVCSNESPGCTGWSWSLPSPLSSVRPNDHSVSLLDDQSWTWPSSLHNCSLHKLTAASRSCQTYLYLVRRQTSGDSGRCEGYPVLLLPSPLLLTSLLIWEADQSYVRYSVCPSSALLTTLLGGRQAGGHSSSWNSPTDLEWCMCGVARGWWRGAESFIDFFTSVISCWGCHSSGSIRSQNKQTQPGVSLHKYYFILFNLITSVLNWV